MNSPQNRITMVETIVSNNTAPLLFRFSQPTIDAKKRNMSDI